MKIVINLDMYAIIISILIVSFQSCFYLIKKSFKFFYNCRVIPVVHCFKNMVVMVCSSELCHGEWDVQDLENLEYIRKYRTISDGLRTLLVEPADKILYINGLDLYYLILSHQHGMIWRTIARFGER